MEKTIYFVRHGQTEFNLKRIIQGSGVDSSLNAKGRTQARAFYQYYAEIPFDLVITSALKRTEETMQPFIEQQIPSYQDPNINEINWGVMEGQVSDKNMIAKYQKMISAWGEDNLDARIEEGESAKELIQRCSSFLNKVKTIEAKNILVCSHGRTLRCMMTLVNEEHPREMEKYEHSNTGLFLTQWDGNQFELLKRNDTTHLENINF